MNGLISGNNLSLENNLPLENKLALVTGASRGLGQALAIELCRQGANLILVARNQGGLLETDDLIRKIQHEQAREVTGAVIAPLNLTESSHISTLAASIFQRFGKLDMLIANAAILGPLSPLSHIEDKDWQAVMEVNLKANYLLIRAFEPLLRLSDQAHALFLTCEQATVPKAYWGLYAASKAGLVAMVSCWKEEMNKTQIKIACIDPKPMSSRLRANAYPGITSHHWPSAQQNAVPLCMKFLMS